MSQPSSPVPQDETPVEIQRSPLTGSPNRSRTVAIIKTHALQHRFEIEQRITEAGFEIAKERQMEFDVETDPDTLYDLFGEDFESFEEGPVWVYVLERRRAVEVWHTLMGDQDPEVARQETTNSIRALYGINRMQNAVMGSPSDQVAEIQIQSIFVSSPPFPTTDLPDVSALGLNQTGSMRSVTSSILSALRQNQLTSSSNGYSGSNGTAEANLSHLSPNGKPAFRARALPSTHEKPDIVPRMSRAAALRAGITIDSPKHVAATKESLAKTFENVPGHKRKETIQVASTAPPVIKPRMTRAASLRLGQMTPPKPTRPRASTGNMDTSVRGRGRASVDGSADVGNTTFEGVPGHKRRESIPVASTRPPSVTPRTNRSAALRVQKESAPPTSFMFREHTTQSRSSSRNSMNPPSTSSRTTTIQRPPSVTKHQPRPSLSSRTPSRKVSLSTSTNGNPRPSLGINSNPGSVSSPTSAPTSSAPTSPPATSPKTEAPPPPAKPRPRVSTALPPAIAPRTNKSALLRAAKMATGANAPEKKGTVGKKTAATPRAIRA